MSRRACAAALAVAAAAAGCTRVPDLIVINSSGGEVQVHADQAPFRPGWQDGIVAIADGAEHKFRHWEPMEWMGGDFRMRLQAGPCAYIYRGEDPHHARKPYEFNIRIRIEPDMRLYYASDARGRQHGAELLAAQPAGYPVAPAEKVCK